MKKNDKTAQMSVKVQESEAAIKSFQAERSASKINGAEENMEQKQVLIHKNQKRALKPKLEHIVKVESVVLDKQKDRCITVNICNAAEKIEDYPEPIQKLVWRALQYKCEIEARRSMGLVSPEHYEKLTKYIETFRHTQQLIFKMCKKRNVGWIIIEGGD